MHQSSLHAKSKYSAFRPPSVFLPRIQSCLHTLYLCLVCRCRDVSTTTGPVDVDVLSDLVLLVCELGLDVEGVGTEVITLGLEQVGGKILSAVTIEPGESG